VVTFSAHDPRSTDNTTLPRPDNRCEPTSRSEIPRGDFAAIRFGADIVEEIVARNTATYDPDLPSNTDIAALPQRRTTSGSSLR
jgi:hypothetical protein